MIGRFEKLKAFGGPCQTDYHGDLNPDGCDRSTHRWKWPKETGDDRWLYVCEKCHEDILGSEIDDEQRA